MPKLGITRSAEELADIMQRAQQTGITILPLELTQTHPLDFKLPDQEYLDQLDWALFTSARGVKIFFERLANSEMKFQYKTRIATVGDKTALALGQFGRSAAFTPKDISSEGMFSEFLNAFENARASALYVSAREPHFNPESLFAGSSIKLSRLSVYETLPADYPPPAGSNFIENDYILFTSPSSVAAYQCFFGAPRASTITLGKTTARKISEQGWPKPIIMAKPDINTVFEYLEEPQVQRRQT